MKERGLCDKAFETFEKHDIVDWREALRENMEILINV